MTDAKKMNLGKELLKKTACECPVFPVLIMPQPSFPCMKPLPPFKHRGGA